MSNGIIRVYCRTLQEGLCPNGLDAKVVPELEMTVACFAICLMCPFSENLPPTDTRVD